MRPAGSARRARPWERTLLAAYVGVLLVVFAALAVDGWRDGLLRRLQAASDAWDRRWEHGLERGETLLAEGRFEQAEQELAALDRSFPAPRVEYARDRERERLLRALAASHEALGRKRRTLEALRRLVAFDPRNYANHAALARAAEHFGESDEALAARREVLRIHPGHLPSVRAVVGAEVGRGDFPAAVAAYERYLDAFHLERVELSTGAGSARASVPVDGRFHDVELVLATPPDARELRLEHGPFAAEVAALELEAPLAVGEPGPPARAAPVLEGDRAPLPASPRGWARARLRLRLFKPVDAELWSEVETAYRNLLDWDGLARARERTRLDGARPPASAPEGDA